MKAIASSFVVVSALAWLAAAAPGIAEDAVPLPAAHLTVEQAINVGNGLNQLGRYETADKDGKPGFAYYKFGAATRMDIAMNIDASRRVQSAFQQAANQLLAATADDTGKVPQEKQAAYNVEVAKLLQAESRVDFIKIKRAKLDLDDNPIPAPTLSLILPVVVE